jgi:hypothetical protein
VLLLDAVLLGFHLDVEHLKVLKKLGPFGFGEGRILGSGVNGNALLPHLLDEGEVIVEQPCVLAFLNLNAAREVGGIRGQRNRLPGDDELNERIARKHQAVFAPLVRRRGHKVEAPLLAHCRRIGVVHLVAIVISQIDGVSLGQAVNPEGEERVLLARSGGRHEEESHQSQGTLRESRKGAEINHRREQWVAANLASGYGSGCEQNL